MQSPPDGPPWDLPVDEAPFAFVDLEMTGLELARDRVLEVCVERFVGGALTAMVSTVVDPGERVGGAEHVHGIGSREINGAPSFVAIAPELLEALDGAIFVAHAAPWDIAFLASEFDRIGLAFHVAHWLDTLVLARRAFALHSHSLDALCRDLGIERGRAHRADSDVRALRAVFDRCVQVLAPVSARDLWEVRVGDRRARQAIVDACAEASRHGAPVLVTYRPARRAPEQLAMVIAQVCSDLDPPQVVGYQLPGRGRRQLRADRILRVELAPGPLREPSRCAASGSFPSHS